jgi:twitching motility protein PilT
MNEQFPLATQFSAMSQFSDVHLNVAVPDDSLVFPGPRRLPPDFLSQAYALIRECEDANHDDFTCNVGGITWRGRRDRNTVDGLWYRLRRMPEKAPTLDSLPSPLPPMVAKMLLSKALIGGGLIYVSGSAGSGKTTTACATVVSRLCEFGGVAYTIEDPPEMPLNGWHGEGYCMQTAVAGDRASDWAEAFRGALRSQPASSRLILFVGEIRNADSAHAMLRAASNGFLVIATGFGTDLVAAVDSLLRLSGDAAVTFANMLRLVIHLRLVGGKMTCEALASVDGTTSVASRIRSGNINQLSNDIEQQRVLGSRGINPFESPIRG